MSPTAIRIAVIADVDSPLAPGLFQSSVDAVQGAAKLINAHGGIAGRKLQVDFIDSKLNPNAARDAVIQACTQDLAMVGTSAALMTNVDDEINCKDQRGVATGLPDLGGIVPGVAQQCSPVSFPVNAPQLLCATRANSTRRPTRGTRARRSIWSRTPTIRCTACSSRHRTR